MSVQEIENAISQLSPREVDTLAVWINELRSNNSSKDNIHSREEDNTLTLADVLKNYIGSVGSEGGSQTSSRDAGTQFTDHLVKKKRDGTL